jgi:hypothetical protein
VNYQIQAAAIVENLATVVPNLRTSVSFDRWPHLETEVQHMVGEQAVEEANGKRSS